jgi:Tfp pilus assembly protein PilF
MAHKRRTHKKLSPGQFLKGLIIRVGLARKVKAREGKVLFQLLWMRIGMVALALMVTGWLSLAGAAYFFVKHARDFPDVRYVDLVFPPRWDNYRQARGDYYIAQAKEKIERGDYSRVVHLLRVGVQQSPDNAEGRLMLASIYNSLARPDLGINLLRDRALSQAHDQDYLSTLISLLFANQEDSAVDQLVTTILGDSKETSDLNLTLALAGATANFNRGDYERAEQFINDFSLLNSRTGSILQARIDWERGYQDLAISRLEKVAQSSGPRAEDALNFLSEYLWASGRQDRALQVALLHFFNDPLNFAPRLRLLSIYNSLGDEAKRSEEIDTYLRLFAKEEPAIQALADFAARAKDPVLAERIHTHARANGMTTETTALRLLEASVAAGDYRGALAFHQSIHREVENWAPLYVDRLQPLLATAFFGIGNTERGEVIFRETLAQRNPNPGEMIRFAQRLIELGDFGRGREILQQLHAAQPLNQEALGRLIRLDMETGNNRDLVRNLNRLLQMRKPPAVVLQEAHRHISSDVFLFERGRGEILTSLESALVNAPVQGS